MAKYKVHEYGKIKELKAEGRTAIVEANSKEKAIVKSLFQKWGATAILIEED